MKKIIMNTLVLLPLFFISVCNSAELETQWRSLDLNNTVLLTLPHGKVVIELAPQFSPHHVARFSQLVRKGFYNGTKFYRVIDGFVAQGGPEDGSDKDKSIKTLAIEGEWSSAKSLPFTLVQNNDLFAEQTGFSKGFAVATNPSEQKAWLTHCPGVLAMARGNTANSASSHFYFVIGQAPRYLDRIMTIFGRVVYGMEHIQAIKRTANMAGEPAVKSSEYTPIVSMQLMSKVTKEQQIIIAVEDTETPTFALKLIKRKKRENAFFYKKPPPALDVCQVPIRSKRIK